MRATVMFVYYNVLVLRLLDDELGNPELVVF